MAITVNTLPVTNPKDGSICFDAVLNQNTSFTIDTNLDATNHQFEWFENTIKLSETNATLTVNKPGAYTVIAKNIQTNCLSNPKTVNVNLISTPIDVKISLSEAFEDNQYIHVFASGGSGSFNYQLDNETVQTSSTFENVKPGEHLITVFDVMGCTPKVIPVTLINYLHYFTPNGDTYHEYWNIIGLKDQPDSRIYIFDRYGKLLKEMNGLYIGWDGTYNGYPLPSTDYWFKVNYKENGIDKEFKAHFSLKR